MTVTTNENGQQNLFAREPKMIVEENYVPHNERAELLNGRAAMCGIIAAFVSYALTGKLFFGVW
jgi:hypothetical protein